MLKKSLLLIALFAAVLLHGAFRLTENGKAKANIVIPENAPKMVKYAAGEFTDFIYRMSGAKLVTTTDKNAANPVFIGFDMDKFEVDQIKIACDGRFAYATIPQELLGKYNFSLKEDEGIIDILREIDGVVIAMLVHQHPEGFKVSLRSKDPRYPVAPIAQAFGGGGHLMAAGATVDLPDFAALEKVFLEKVSAARAD